MIGRNPEEKTEEYVETEAPRKLTFTTALEYADLNKEENQECPCCDEYGCDCDVGDKLRNTVSFSLDRCYELFYVLAGVREDKRFKSKTISEPRDWPQESMSMGKNHWMEKFHHNKMKSNPDYHTRSFYYLDELNNHREAFANIEDWESVKELSDILDTVGMMSKSPRDIRVLFFFDN